MNLADKIRQIEKERDDFATVIGERDALQNQLREQVGANAEMRRQLEQMKAVLAERDARAGELGPLVELLRETCTQIAAKVGG